MPDFPDTALTGTVIEPSFVGSACELQDGKGQFLAHCRIRSVRERTIDLELRVGEPAPRLLFGMPVMLSIYNPKHGAKFLSGAMHGVHAGIVRVSGMEVIQESDRREFVRVPTYDHGVLEPVSVHAPLELVSAGKRDGTEDDAPINVRIENISLSGLQFGCDSMLQKGDRFIIDFTPIKEPMRIQCEVVRFFKDDLGRFHYGCRLLPMQGQETARLNKILMKLQLGSRAGSR